MGRGISWVLATVVTMSCGSDRVPEPENDEPSVAPATKVASETPTEKPAGASAAASGAPLDAGTTDAANSNQRDAGMLRVTKLPKREKDPLVVERKLSVRHLATPAGTFRLGMRVGRAKRGMVLGPSVTGLSRPITFGPKQTGTVRGFVERRLKGTDAPPWREVVVRWEKQVWHFWLSPLDKPGRSPGALPKGPRPSWKAQLGAQVELPTITLSALPKELRPLE